MLVSACAVLLVLLNVALVTCLVRRRLRMRKDEDEADAAGAKSGGSASTGSSTCGGEGKQRAQQAQLRLWLMVLEASSMPCFFDFFLERISSIFYPFPDSRSAKNSFEP